MIIVQVKFRRYHWTLYSSNVVSYLTYRDNSQFIFRTNFIRNLTQHFPFTKIVQNSKNDLASGQSSLYPVGFIMLLWTASFNKPPLYATAKTKPDFSA